MSRSLNLVHLIGRVGADPEIRATTGGSRVAKVSLATNRQWKDKSGASHEAVDWHTCVLWGRLADVAEQWIRKGDQLYVQGRIEYRRNDGEQGVRFWTDVVVSELIMLGSPSHGVERGDAHEEEERPPVRKPAAAGAARGAAADDEDSDLPF